ncbi:MAG: hypothetical protein ACOYT8_04965 [Candidatus Dependentiae bacterium]
MIHKDLTHERWFKFTLFEQLANVGMDIERTIEWKNKNSEYSRQAFERALELLDLTIADPKNKKRLKELCRARYLLVDHFAFDNEYQSTDQEWQDYFYQFNYAAALARGR